MSISSSTNQARWFEWIKTQRFFVYALAFILRAILSMFFIDKNDGPVFEDTTYDILIRNTNIYNEDSLHNLFNYFPLAYLAILPGVAIYYLFDFDNKFLFRLFLKLPLLVTDIMLAFVLNRHMAFHKYSEEKISNNKDIQSLKPNDHEQNSKHEISKKNISQVELFILFNPFIIYTSSIKGQFDVIPVFFLLLGWREFEKEKFVKSGFYIAISILFKQYGVLFSYILGLTLLRTKYNKVYRFILGHLLIAIPVIGIAVLWNSEGLLYHAVEYHLERPYAGFSFAAILNFFVQYVIINLINILFLTLLIYVLIYRGYILWNSDNSPSDIIRALIYSYIAFFLLNTVLFEQYSIIFMVLWVEQKFINHGKILDTSLYWNYAVIPLSLIFRVFFMTPPDVQEIFGPYWIQIIWFSGIFIHFILMYIFTKREKQLFRFWYSKVIYTFILIIMPFHYLVMTNREEAFDFFYTS
ncbi:MAG: hypothetical protein ACW99A_06305 [Candidatus Kariarchaeaceae archaeon]|jgi:hypothetical protein